jgi:hypothetical protein
MPYPFGRGLFIWGKPIYVAPEASPEIFEAKRLEVEGALNEITARADKEVSE